VSILGAAWAAPAYAGGSLKDDYIPPVFSWTGFYLGVHGGGAYTDVSVQDVNNYNTPPNSISHDGWQGFGGVQFGVNQQTGNVVVGIEVDLGYLGMDSSAQYAPFIGVPARVGDSVASIDGGFYGTTTLRIGVAYGRTLFYAKGGLAFADVEASYVDPNPTGITLASGTSNRDMVYGGTIGGGFEYAFTDHFTFKTEYLYMDLGDISHTATSTGAPALATFVHDLETHTVKIGLNYKF